MCAGYGLAEVLRERLPTSSERLLANVERVVLGKHEQIALVVAALAAQRHVVLEDVPGTAKTIPRSSERSNGVTRIQRKDAAALFILDTSRSMAASSGQRAARGSPAPSWPRWHCAPRFPTSSRASQP
jgi:Mg-chelatase subunit ChlD